MHAMGPAFIDAVRLRAALPFGPLIDALRDAFIAGAEVPLRHRHAVGQDRQSLLLMPAWRPGVALGVKIVSVFPGNGARGLNAVSSTYLLCDALTGQHLAVLDGNELTSRRTAAASALAGRYLAREDASTLLIVGSGHVASLMAAAWRAVRPIRRVLVWNIRHVGAVRLAAELVAAGFDAMAVEDLPAAAGVADIISCATLSDTPLLAGAWLRPGTHIDLIGGYLPSMREADDDAVRKADIYIDTEAALDEAGDLIQPMASGALTPDQVRGTLAALCRGEIAGRTRPHAITLFKSVGSAIEDLAAAALALALALAQ